MDNSRLNNPATTEKPLVTLAIIAFNQEEYIREAIEGALSQTYSPLEILVSDDCSTDGTYDIIQKIAAEYQGPHTVRTHRPDANLGIGQHVNRVGELAQGEFVLLAGGDDISEPLRAERLAECWLNSGRQACSIYSNMSLIDGQGNLTKPLYDTTNKGVHATSLEDVLKQETAGLFGCTQGVDRRVFSMFKPMDKDVLHEDEILPFRALLLGKIEYVPEPLVKYRRHETNVWGRENNFASLKEAKAWNKKRLNRQLAAWRTWLRDLADSKRDDLIETFTPRFERLVHGKQVEFGMCDKNIVLALMSTIRLVIGGTGLKTTWKIFRRTQLRPWFEAIRGKLKRAKGPTAP